TPARMTAWLVELLLRALLKILSLGLHLPGATLRVPSPPVWVWLVYGAALAAVVVAIRKRWPRVFVGSIGAVFALQAIVAFTDFSPNPPDAVTLTFLD